MRSIRQRLLLLVAIPLLALLVTAANILARAYQDYRSAQLTSQALRVGVAAGELIHTLQIERGATAGFLQSKGAKFADELPTIRQKTDGRLTEYTGMAGDGGQHDLMTKALTQAQERLSGLQLVRERADKQDISVPEQVTAYTGTVSALINIIGISQKLSSSPAVIQQTSAYLALVRAKEQAGQERALVTAAFAANAVEPKRYVMILERFHRQEAYLDLFRSAASDQALQSLEGALNGTPAKEVQRMRGVFVEKSAVGGFEVNPTLWFDTITQKIDALHETENVVIQGITTSTQETLASSQRTLYGYSFLMIVAVVLVGVASLWISASVANPLHAEVKVAEDAVQNSDFTHEVPESGPVEVMRAGHAFNQLMQSFRQIVTNQKTYCARVTQAAHTLASSSREVQSSSEAQSDATSAVAAAVEQASVSISETNANARSAAEMVESSRADTLEALRVMGEAVSNMRDIVAHIRGSSEQITALSEASQKIGGIVQVINEIAEQTNLLALNAAIEAARAGEQGRGFAVVADEVRKLAERTGQATREIGGLIASMQTGVAGAVEAMSSANQQADTSLERVGATETALNRIDGDSRHVAESVMAISGALQEQDAAIRQIAQSIEQIAQMTERNAHAAEMNNATAGELSRLADELQGSVSRFRV